MQSQAAVGDREHGNKRINRRGVVVDPQHIGIDAGQPKRLQRQSVIGALAGPVATHDDPQLGAFAQAATGSQGQNTPPAKVPALMLPSLSIRSSKPGWLRQAW